MIVVMVIQVYCCSCVVIQRGVIFPGFHNSTAQRNLRIVLIIKLSHEFHQTMRQFLFFFKLTVAATRGGYTQVCNLAVASTLPSTAKVRNEIIQKRNHVDVVLFGRSVRWLVVHSPAERLCLVCVRLIYSLPATE